MKKLLVSFVCVLLILSGCESDSEECPKCPDCVINSDIEKTSNELLLESIQAIDTENTFADFLGKNIAASVNKMGVNYVDYIPEIVIDDDFCTITIKSKDPFDLFDKFLYLKFPINNPNEYTYDYYWLSAFVYERYNDTAMGLMVYHNTSTGDESSQLHGIKQDVYDVWLNKEKYCLADENMECINFLDSIQKLRYGYLSTAIFESGIFEKSLNQYAINIADKINEANKSLE